MEEFSICIALCGQSGRQVLYQLDRKVVRIPTILYLICAQELIELLCCDSSLGWNLLYEELYFAVQSMQLKKFSATKGRLP